MSDRPPPGIAAPGRWPEAVTFAEVWDRAVERDPGALFLRYAAPDGTVGEWSYGSFDRQIDGVAARLDAAGVRPGRAVHMALANGPAFVAVWLASVRLGAVMVPSDPFGRAPELAGHISRTEPAVGLCAADRAEEYRRGCAEAAELEPALDMDLIAVDEHAPDLVSLTGEVGRSGPVAVRADAGVRDTASIMFTSGTTGRPKGVEITQANYAFCGKIMAERAGFGPGHRLLVVLPLFHGNAQYYSFAAAIWSGAAIVLQPAFSASRFCAQAAAGEATAASLFAAPMRMILARGGDGPALGLDHCWYAQNVNDAQYAQLSELFGCLPRQLWGMTETLPAALTNPRVDPVPSSMGQQTPGCLVDIQDAAGGPVPDGEVGELVVGGERGITLFSGYLDDPETTEASFRDGWLLTGDRARRDGAGHYYFDGRHSEVLKVSGENVSVVAVEAVLAAHPAVLEAAVVGRPDPIRDEVPVGFVVARDPVRPPSSAELLAWCGERLGKAAMPRDLTLLDELPRTSVGKIRKFLLAGRAAAGA
ncbi:MAG: ATP-dependent acyl-CoA ligase [Acidimicrobiia bacterium]|nr:ATP-dependent acyl-CoA ligase [Acidimicrobiia bacterium]MYC45434.1 ATP-dependent acyl-CoA ligase [Acidimicrobiia bacterium]